MIFSGGQVPPPSALPQVITWDEIDQLIDHLLPQFRGEFDGLLMITRGGLIPGGLLSEAMGIKHVLTATVHFPGNIDSKLAWPTFIQFPPDTLLTDRRILAVNDIWASGRESVIVQGRLAAVGCECETAVLHYRPQANMFPGLGPDYYGAITDRYIVYPWETAVGPTRRSI